MAHSFALVFLFNLGYVSLRQSKILDFLKETHPKLNAALFCSKCFCFFDTFLPVGRLCWKTIYVTTFSTFFSTTTKEHFHGVLRDFIGKWNGFFRTSLHYFCVAL